jgi:dolichol-phosphate mannosyltransferase
VPIAFADRLRGTSKMSSRIVVEALALVTWWGLRDRLLRRRR